RLGRADLALPAIDDHEVGHGPAALLLAAFVARSRDPESPAQDLLVAGEVVGALHGLYSEPAVLAAARLAVLEHEHAADRFAALEVGDVVALDAERQPGETQRLGQLFEG